MVESEFGKFVERKPMGFVFFDSPAVDIGYIHKSTIRYRDHAFARIAIDGTEGTDLMHVYVGKTGKVAEHTCSRIVDTFIEAHEATHKRPFAGFGFETSFGEQEAEPSLIKTENHTIDGYI